MNRKRVLLETINRKADLALLRLDAVERAVAALAKGETVMAGELDALKAQVAKNGDVEQSAVTLLQGLKAQLDAAVANNDIAAVKALSDQIGKQDDELAAAILQNTPAAPTPGPPTS